MVETFYLRDLICALAFGLMPAAGFGQDGTVDITDTRAGPRFAQERLFSAPAWGEGPSYTGPGGAWYTRSTSP